MSGTRDNHDADRRERDAGERRPPPSVPTAALIMPLFGFGRHLSLGKLSKPG